MVDWHETNGNNAEWKYFVTVVADCVSGDDVEFYYLCDVEITKAFESTTAAVLPKILRKF